MLIHISIPIHLFPDELAWIITFGHTLLKEEQESTWSGPLSEDQIQYAALDAWTPLKIWNTLKDEPTVGMPLKSASPVGQLVSIQVQSQEVARGVLVSQPRQFTVAQDASGKSIVLNISTTKTRAVVQIDEILAPNYILSLHKDPKRIKRESDFF
jgi:hypothetical protein